MDCLTKTLSSSFCWVIFFFFLRMIESGIRDRQNEIQQNQNRPGPGQSSSQQYSYWWWLKSQSWTSTIPFLDSFILFPILKPHTHMTLLCLYSMKKQLDMLLFNIVYCKIETWPIDWLVNVFNGHHTLWKACTLKGYKIFLYYTYIEWMNFSSEDDLNFSRQLETYTELVTFL